jgi:hypothetical protein
MLGKARMIMLDTKLNELSILSSRPVSIKHNLVIELVQTPKIGPQVNGFRLVMAVHKQKVTKNTRW